MAARPTVALFAGDPAGVGPEIVAKLPAEPETARSADVLLIAGRASFDVRAKATLVEWQGLDAPAFPLGVEWLSREELRNIGMNWRGHEWMVLRGRALASVNISTGSVEQASGLFPFFGEIA